MIKSIATLFLAAGMIMSCKPVKASFNSDAADNAASRKDYIERTYKCAAFDKVDIGTVASVTITQSVGTEVKVIAPEQFLKNLSVRSANGTLVMKMLKGYSSRHIDKKICIIISVPHLSSVIASGVGDVTLKGRFEEKMISLEHSGVGEMTIENLNCQHLNAIQKGVGDLVVKGTANYASYTQMGVGNVNAEDMIAKEVLASSVGVGELSCYASESITASATGVGSVKYKGNPAKKNVQSLKGMGNVENDD